MKRRGGGTLKLTDFLPDFAKPEEEDWIEREMAEAAKHLNQNG